MFLLVLSSNGVAWILFGLVCFFGIIALVVFLLRKFLKISKTDKPKDETKVADENLNHYLEDVDDPEAQKQFDEFEKQQKDTKKENNEKENK